MSNQSANAAPHTGKRVVLINGIPASGKSSVAQALAEATGWPVMSLDGVKNPFLQLLGAVDRPMNRLLGRASYQAIWSIVSSAPAGNTFIIDAWFGFQPREVLEEYVAASGATHIAEVWCQIDGSLAAKRYQARLADRLPGHPGAEYLPELIELAKKAAPMGLGPLLEVDQSQPVDIASVVNWCRKVLF